MCDDAAVGARSTLAKSLTYLSVSPPFFRLSVGLFLLTTRHIQEGSELHEILQFLLATP